jgi:peptidoglycan/LPS O-acetylase OafA/YrhL
MAKKRRKPRPRRPSPATTEPTSTPQPAKAPARPPRKPIEEERPPAPWGSFPLVEVVVLIALVMLIAAFVTGGPRSTALLATGLALGSLAGLELSVREHFGGYRSHTLLLAGAAGVATLALLFYAVPDLMPPAARLAVAGVVAVATALLLARAFRARSGRLLKVR